VVVAGVNLPAVGDVQYKARAKTLIGGKGSNFRAFEEDGEKYAAARHQNACSE
jgi:hypothetical protein